MIFELDDPSLEAKIACHPHAALHTGAKQAGFEVMYEGR